MKPKRKPSGIAAQFLKKHRMVHLPDAGPDYEEIVPHAPRAAADATRVGDHEFRGDDAMVSTMDEHGVEDLVNNLSQPERKPMTEWNPADPWSADNPEVAKQLRTGKRKFGK